eukprot:4026487-Prymnesium_polylepis.1
MDRACRESIDHPLCPLESPCFPSAALVTKADGTLSRIDKLQEGDEIVAASIEGKRTTGTVSLFSLANPEAIGTFIELTTNAGKLIYLTSEHHLPTGDECCSNITQAKNVAVGDKIWAMIESGALESQTVIDVSSSIREGLHSPVLQSGALPVVDGIVTSFDSLTAVKTYEMFQPYLELLMKKTGTSNFVRSLLPASRRKYIDGFRP